MFKRSISTRLFVVLAVMICGPSLFGAIKTQTIEYKQGNTTLKGYLAYDNSSSGKRPGVIVVPEWWGNNDYAHHRAEMLAELGYVGFAIDMYGDGKTTTDPKQATEWSNEAKKDPKVEMARAQAALDTLKGQAMVDPEKLLAIGYCFGGGVALNMARENFPLLGVVSFHGELTSGGSPATSVKPQILVCHGAEDTFVPLPAVVSFIEEMKKAGANFQVSLYSGASHSFTNPNAGKYNLPGISYNKQADERSWQEMQDFFKAVLTP